MTVKDIKIYFIRNDITQADIAARLKVSNAAICRVISGKSKSRRIQETIARMLNMRVEDVWGDEERVA